MRHLILVFLIALAAFMNTYSQTADKLAELWEKGHIVTIFPSDIRHADLKKYLDVLKKQGVTVNEVGRSNANREIYQMEWGKGPLKVFMWSQMHGDEPTATAALIDMFAFLQNHHEKDWVKRIAETMTIRAVPMLNPDGQEMYQRRNLQGIDVNRDALDLKTPEALGCSSSFVTIGIRRSDSTCTTKVRLPPPDVLRIRLQYRSWRFLATRQKPLTTVRNATAESRRA